MVDDVLGFQTLSGILGDRVAFQGVDIASADLRTVSLQIDGV